MLCSSDKINNYCCYMKNNGSVILLNDVTLYSTDYI